MASTTGSDDGTSSLHMKEAPPIRSAWKNVPAAATDHHCIDEKLWPPLPGCKVMAPTAAASSSADPPAVAEQATKASSSTSKRNPGSSCTSQGNRAAPVPERLTVVPSSSSTMNESNNNMGNGGAGFRDRQNLNQFTLHRRGRSGGWGYNNNGRRTVGTANNGVSHGDVNVHVHGNFSGGGFNNNNNNNGQGRDGRSHRNGNWHGQGHRRLGHQQMDRIQPPHHRYPQLPPPPLFMGMVAPALLYDPYGAYGPYVYFAEAAAPGYYFPPPQEGIPFMPYPAPPMHIMPRRWEQNDAAFGISSSMEQKVQQDAPSPPTAEDLQKSIRSQIEHYFSPINLNTDAYLKSRMDKYGWAPLTVIAGFRRVKAMSTDLDLITASLLPSDEVEVKDGKIRKCIGWEEYITPEATEHGN